KFRKTVAVLVGLARPHANHGIAARSPETIDQSDVVLEMAIQGGPLSGKRPLHDGEFHLPLVGLLPILTPHTRRNWGYYWRLKYDGCPGVNVTLMGGAPATSFRSRREIARTLRSQERLQHNF